MKKPLPTRLALAMSAAGFACALVTPAQAADEGITYKVSGYGTLAGTLTNKGDLQFRSSLNQSKGANSTLDLGVDSRLGLQGVVNFNNGFSVTAQALAQRRRVDDELDSNRDFDIGVEWLFAQYAVMPDLDVRMGRVVLPAFMISDSRNVGYAQPWLRAPLEVYAQMPLTNVDGVQATWRIPLGSAIVSVQPTFGKSNVNISSGSIVIKETTKRTYAINATLEWGSWLARVGQVKGTTPVSLALLNVPPANISTPIQYDMKDTFTTVGLQFDNGQAVAMFEWAKRKQNDMPITPTGFSGIPLFVYNASGLGGTPLAESHSWYLAGGWHLGKWLPMLAYGSYSSTAPRSRSQVDSINLSLRYDLQTNVALKAQIGRHEAKDAATFIGGAATDDRKVTVFSFGVDFVF